MKILFLDIDGVVNNYATMQRFNGFIGIKPELAAIVQRIVKETGCSVVLSSTWRTDTASRLHIRKMVVPFIACTPVSLGRRFRGNEVNAWLAEHPEVERHAILDDDGDFHPDQPLFQTIFQTGITNDIADSVIEYLNKS